MKYLKLFESFNLGKQKFYHITIKKNLDGLLNGIRIDKAQDWGQGPGFYVNTSEKLQDEQEGVGSNVVDLMIEIEAELSSDNFDMDYEMNYQLGGIVEKQIPNLKKLFKKQFTISKDNNYFSIFTNNLKPEDFQFETIKFREDNTIIPICSDDDWCYLPITVDNKVKVSNNIYGITLTRNFMDRLDNFEIKELIQKDLFSIKEPIALRYIGPVIKPTRYKEKDIKKNTWSSWINNDK
jgi:hypothetical protein